MPLEKDLLERLRSVDSTGIDALWTGRYGSEVASRGVYGAPPEWWQAQVKSSANDRFDYLRKGLWRAFDEHPGAFTEVYVLGCGDRSKVARVKAQLEQFGFGERGRLSVTPLDPLGMILLRLPPLLPVAEALAEIEGVSLVGDGLKPYTMVPPRSPDPEHLSNQTGAWPQGLKPFFAGAYECAVRAMGLTEQLYEHLFSENGLLVNGRVPVRVAVVDSGIDAQLPNFRVNEENTVIAARDFTSTRLGPVDSAGHGTHVGGIIAGADLGERRFMGIAPNARLLDVQVMEPAAPDPTRTEQVLRGLSWAIEVGAEVINMSLGPPDGSARSGVKSVEWMAMEACERHGALLVLAAGNSGEQVPGPSIGVPNDYPGGVCVGATDAEGNKAVFSSWGPAIDAKASGMKPDVAAPGVGIISARARSSHQPPIHPQVRFYSAMSGTSMAAPMISGLVALAIGHLRKMDIRPEPWRIREALLQSCKNVRQLPPEAVGRGVPNGAAFLRFLESACGASVSRPPPKTVSFAPPLTSASNDELVAAQVREPTVFNERALEREWVFKLSHRVEEIVRKEGAAFFGKGLIPRPFSVRWSESDGSARLRAFRARSQLSENLAALLPLGVARTGEILRGSSVVGRVHLRYLVHYTTDNGSVDCSVSLAEALEVFGRIPDGPSDFVCLMGRFRNFLESWSPDSQRRSLLGFVDGTDGPVFLGNHDDLLLLRMFFPLTESEILFRVEDYLRDHNAVPTAHLADALGIPEMLIKFSADSLKDFRIRPAYLEGKDFLVRN
ncbi:MAG: S8 family serine peptidase [Opitutales bacterium]|nr:S8 family serine peptidase [Opitutales bacterium]